MQMAYEAESETGSWYGSVFRVHGLKPAAETDGPKTHEVISRHVGLVWRPPWAVRLFLKGHDWRCCVSDLHGCLRVDRVFCSPTRLASTRLLRFYSSLSVFSSDIRAGLAFDKSFLFLPPAVLRIAVNAAVASAHYYGDSNRL